MKIEKIKKVVIQLTLLGLLLYWAAVISLIKVEYNHLVVSEKNDLRQLARTASYQVFQKIDSIDFFMKEISRWIKYSSQEDTSSQLAEYVESFTGRSYGTLQLNVIDDQGKIFTFPPSSENVVADTGDSEFFAFLEKLDPEVFYVAKPVFSLLSESWVIPLLMKPENNSRGISLLAVKAEMKMISDIFESVVTKENYSSVMLIRDDGLILSVFPFDNDVVGNRLDEKSYRQISENRFGDILLAPVGKEGRNRKLFIYDTVSGYPLRVAIEADYSDITDKWLMRSVSRIIMHLIASLLVIYLVRKFIFLLNEILAAQKKLEISARYDSMTGLMNRKYFFERLEEEIARSVRYGKKMSFISIDADHFKVINDKYGHPKGDCVISMLGSIIRENIRETDFAGRLGGEEFSVVLPETSAEDGKVIAERIRNAVHSIKVEDRTVSVSLGVTALIEKDSADSVYLRSDKALYKSKKRGRDCTTVLLR